jgi:hypothetical protein
MNILLAIAVAERNEKMAKRGFYLHFGATRRAEEFAEEP